MDATAPNSKFLFLFFLSLLLVCSQGSILSPVKNFLQKEFERSEEQKPFHSSRRELLKTVQHDFMNPPITTDPTSPVTNPVTTPVTNPVTTPAIGTFPPDGGSTPANPVTVTPTPVTFPPVTNPATPVTNPVTNPVTSPVANPATPVTNPVTTPSTSIPGPAQPLTNPGSTYPTPMGGVPVVAPPVGTNAPAVPGQSWCVAKGGVSETAIQSALDYACGIADCSGIQQGASCYNPNNLISHASYAFNSYYQKNPVPTSCDFGGAAMITNVNPSSGSCTFPTSSSSASPTIGSPFVTNPTTPTPTTESSSGATIPPIGSGAPPNVMNASNPALGDGITGGGISGYGESPQGANISSSSSLQPFIGCIIVVTSIITGTII